MRNIRKKYKRPKRPYDSVRIKEEKEILRKYGLRRKKEIWRAENIIRAFRQRARELIATKDKEKEKILIDKLIRMGILPEKSTLDDVLALNLDHILNRRLQTVIFKKGLATTPKEARQMIVHRRITVSGRVAKYPSYLVAREEEGKIKAASATEG
jgi:small subunit ribosomal protein S4